MLLPTWFCKHVWMRLQNLSPIIIPRKSGYEKLTDPRLNIISNLWTYDLYRPIRNAFDAGRYITRGSGRGLGPEIETFWALWNGIEPLGECHLWPKQNSRDTEYRIQKLIYIKCKIQNSSKTKKHSVPTSSNTAHMKDCRRKVLNRRRLRGIR